MSKSKDTTTLDEAAQVDDNANFLGGNEEAEARREQERDPASKSPAAPSDEEVDKQKRAEQLKQSKAAKQKKAARRNTERNLRNLQQCLLGENLNKISMYHRQNPDLFRYQTFRQMYGSSEKIVSVLKGLPDLEGFLCIRTSVLSLLQPELKIFKVTHATKVGETGKTTPTDPILKEIVFSDSFGKETATSTQKYLSMESQEPNWRNVGLTNFTFHQIGRSHGAVEQNIKCTLQLYLKTLKDLVATSPGSDARFVDLLLFPGKKISRDTEQYNPKHYEIRVALGYKRPSTQSIIALSPTAAELDFLKNINRFNWVVTLGLHKYDFKIKETGEVDVTIDYFGRIESAFNSSGTSPLQGSIVVPKSGGFKMQPKTQGSHDFASFSKVKGKLGALVTFKKNPDLAIDNIEKLGKELCEDPLFRELYKQAYDAEINPELDIDVETAVEKLTSKTGAPVMSGVLRRASNSLKNEAYKVFMQQILEGNSSKGGAGNRLFAISVSKEHIDDALGIINDPPKKPDKAKREEIKSATSSAIGLAAKSVTVGRPTDIAALEQAPSITEINAEDRQGSVTAESAAQDSGPDPIKDMEAAMKTSIITSKASGDSYEFYYLYLGDIIELAAKNAGLYAFLEEKNPPFLPGSYRKDEKGEDYGLSKMRFLLGPLEYIDSEKRIKNINLAEFPISFDLFRNWFIEKIVKEDSSKISFGSFLNKLINQLVLPAFGADCLRPIMLRNTKFEDIYMTLPGRTVSTGPKLQGAFPTEELLPKELPDAPKAGKLDVDSPSFQGMWTDKVKTATSLESLAQTGHDYKLVQVNSIKSLGSRNGNCQEDMKDGIYHFNIGSDRGLLKEMLFTKDNLKGLAELRSLQAIQGGGDQLSQLSFPFNCTLKLVGNTLFLPGMFFYANPSFLGLGRPEDKNSIAHQLNLGGYFLILETKLRISPGVFETEVIGRTQGHGKVKL